MLKVLCPRCQKEVNIDDPVIQKEEDGLDLRVHCPHDDTWFVVQRVKQIRDKLMVAQFAVTKNVNGETIKIRID